MSNNGNNKILYHIIKRLFDFFVSLICIIILLPLFLIVSLVVFIGDPGKIFYGQERVGKGGKHLKVWKFRSMYKNADAMIDKLTPEQWKQYHTEFKIDNDPRITKVGKFLRKTSIDELPQLFNILNGEMSFVGPRPVIESELEWYGENKDKFLSVTPGLTGWWASHGRSNIKYPERCQYELYYVDNASISLDIRILIKTIFSVSNRSGAR